MGNILDKMKELREQAEKENLERKRKEEELSNSVLESQGLEIKDPKEVLEKQKGWFSEALGQANSAPVKKYEGPPPPINQFKVQKKTQPRPINNSPISPNSAHFPSSKTSSQPINTLSNQDYNLNNTDLDNESIDFSDIDLFEDDVLLDISKEQEYLDQIEELKVEAETAKSQKYEIMLQYQSALDKVSEMSTRISQQDALINQYKENLDKQKELSNALRQKVKDLTEKTKSIDKTSEENDIMGEIEDNINESQRMFETLMGKTHEKKQESKEDTKKISEIVKEYQDKIDEKQNEINKLLSKVKKLESRKSKIEEIKRLTRENKLLVEKVEVLEKQAGGDAQIQSLILDYERKIKRLKIELKKARQN